MELNKNETSKDQIVLQLNLQLQELLRKKSELTENEFISSLGDFCSKIPDGLRVVFDIHTPLNTTSAFTEELHNRFVQAGIANESQEDVTLVIQSPQIGFSDVIGNTSAGRNAVLSGENRQPFKIESYTDANLVTRKSIGSRNVLALNPHGTLIYGSKPYNLLADTISKVFISTDMSLPLTPALMSTGEIFPIQAWK
jgi:hypothetical protein